LKITILPSIIVFPANNFKKKLPEKTIKGIICSFTTTENILKKKAA